MLLEIKVVKKRNLLYFNNFAQLFINMAKVKYYYDTKTLNYHENKEIDVMCLYWISDCYYHV